MDIKWIYNKLRNHIEKTFNYYKKHDNRQNDAKLGKFRKQISLQSKVKATLRH